MPCYEASGAGYVLQRALDEWGVECQLAAPSLIPRQPGDRRKTDHRDAIKLGQDFRDGRLALIHIPTEEEERVRDVVRCRETFQREIVKSRHYILKFMRRRGFIYREGTHWTTRHLNWIRQVLFPGTLADEDRLVLTEYLALLESWPTSASFPENAPQENADAWAPSPRPATPGSDMS